MTRVVVTSEAHRTVRHIREIMEKNSVSALPIVSADGQPLGIVSTTDLLPELEENTAVGQIMTKNIYTISMYGDVSTAARVMRNHRIHRLIVTDENRVVGILSAFDLLKVMEDHRYIEDKANPS